MPLFTGSKFGFGLSNEAGGAAGPTGHTASGGVISDYTVGSDKYRAHIFTSSGSFVISSLSETFPATADYFMVGGGGGGGGGHPTSSVGAGGGGGGGHATATGLSVTAQTYTITVGTGGQGECYNADTDYSAGYNGNDSIISTPTVGIVTAYGGGGGASRTPFGASANARSGGSGGGSAYQGPRLGYGLNPTAPAPVMPQIGSNLTHPWPSPLQQGYDGGDSPGDAENPAGAGGGGAGGPGTNGDNGPEGAAGGDGGNGKQSLYGYGPTVNSKYGGGGGGAAGTNPTKSDPLRGEGINGGGDGAYGGGPWVTPGVTGPLASYEMQGVSGLDALGGGGGGGGCTSPLAPGPETAQQGGYGGAGTVIIRYKIAASETGTAQATGGAISFAGGRTIHTFLYSGTFTNPTSITDVNFLVVGGGGGGSGNNGAGGGGGGVIYATGQTLASGGHTCTIGQGGPASSSKVDNSLSPTVPGGGRPGFDSSFVFSPTITATAGGGGGGAGYSGGTHVGLPGSASTVSGGLPTNCHVIGGSGGGGTYPSTAGGEGGGASGGSSSDPPTAHDGGTGVGDAGNGQTYGGGGGASPTAGEGIDGSAGTAPTTAGNGGDGYTCDILGTSYVWAGGGGAAATTNIKAGDGGTGGGGGGGCTGPAVPGATFGEGGTGGLGAGQDGTAVAMAPQPATGPTKAFGYAGAGAANTGGGGGGIGAKCSAFKGYYGGKGGCGIVIISYPT